MKIKFKLLYAFIGLAMLFSACTPQEFELGSVLDKSELKFSIVPDATDPNMIVLTSLTPNATPQWITPYGKSIRVRDTVKIAFPGEYDFVYGVQCAGGLVQADTVTVNITTTNLSYVNDPLWTNLCGGVDQSKTWLPDNGKYGFAAGFMSYADPSVSQEYENFVVNWDPGNGTLGVTETDLSSTMTFDLIGGPHLTVSKPNEPGESTSGTYYLDASGHTLTTNDVTVPRIAARIAEVTNWSSNVKVLKLTKDQLRLAFMRTDPEQGAWWEIYNYVSKEYADNYTPSEPEPTLPDNWQTDVSKNVTTSIKWVLSTETPFNWANLDGSLMNTAWTSADKYDGWTGYSASAASNFEKFSLTLNSEDNTATYVDPNGTSTSGSYTLDEKGVFTFNGFKPNFVICGGWVTLSTTDDNQWRITKIEKNASGAVSGMWVGKRDPNKAEYMVYHLIPEAGDSSDPLAAWKKAFVGKTFKPDVNWFIDWVNFDFSGGWTSATTFGSDYTSNSWVWTEKTRAIAESATLKFEMVGTQIRATLTQDLYNADGTLATAGYTVSGKVTFNTDLSAIVFSIPLVDYTGSPASWLNTTNEKGKYWTEELRSKEWLLTSHGDSNLGNIDEKGFWLGAVTNSISGGDSKDEILTFHYILAQ